MSILGTSQIYGASARRPSPTILNSWPAGWQFQDLLPYFKKMEDHYCYYDSSNITGITADQCRAWHGKYVSTLIFTSGEISILTSFMNQRRSRANQRARYWSVRGFYLGLLEYSRQRQFLRWLLTRPEWRPCAVRTRDLKFQRIVANVPPCRLIDEAVLLCGRNSVTDRIEMTDCRLRHVSAPKVLIWHLRSNNVPICS
jgi:hypothetical protein